MLHYSLLFFKHQTLPARVGRLDARNNKSNRSYFCQPIVTEQLNESLTIGYSRAGKEDRVKTD